MKPSTMSQWAADPASGGASAASRPIDLVHLSKYTLGDRSLETELLGLFRAQADIYLSRLADAVGDSEWKNAAHSLKGSACGLGAWTLAEVAGEAEALCADAGSRADVMARIRDAVTAVNGFIDSFAEV
tara:strand:+ start:3306 stop:3692 length:387 start_codon:yes stop_codon:yes gene_type:complete